MAPKPVAAAPNDVRLVGVVSAWAKLVWKAVQKRDEYATQHDALFKEFDRLRDEIKASRDPLLNDHRCLFHHVESIYNHTASQGYQPNIHYEPLCQAVLNWCHMTAVQVWIAPPDQHSRSASPIIPPEPTPRTTRVADRPVATPAPRSQRVTDPPAPMPAPQADRPVPTPAPRKRPAAMTVSQPGGSKQVPTKGEKGKAKQTGKGSRSKPAPTSPEYIEEEDADAKPDADVKPDPPASRALPSTDHLDAHDPKCVRCQKADHGCHVHPSATACFECNHWKVRCSLVKADKVEGEPEDPDATSGPKKRTGGSRKKPVGVPAGEPGQFGGKFGFFFLFFLFIIRLQPLKSPPTS